MVVDRRKDLESKVIFKTFFEWEDIQEQKKN
jgi:hypothetical protein